MRNPLAHDLDHVLAQTSGLWEELRGARVFITGGTGFFGCWLLETFLWANDHLGLDASVVVLTRDGSAFARKAPHLASSSGGDAARRRRPHVRVPRRRVLARHPRGDGFETRRRAAAIACWSSTRLSDGTRRTLEFARRAGARRFLLTSSGAVYGRQPAELDARARRVRRRARPRGPGARRCRGEARRGDALRDVRRCAICSRRSRGASRSSARTCRSMSISRSGTSSATRSRAVRFACSGDGTPYRSYLYAADLAIWLWTILLRGAVAAPVQRRFRGGDLDRAIWRTPSRGGSPLNRPCGSPARRRPVRRSSDTCRARRESRTRAGRRR